MRFSHLSAVLIYAFDVSFAGPLVENSGLQKRQDTRTEPIEGDLGAPFSGDVTNPQIDLQNPDNLQPEATDGGTVPNLKWSFSDSKERLFDGGWVRQQVVSDLPISDIFSAGQVHLKKGSSRELHWHRCDEWAYVYAGSARVSAVDENGQNQITTAQTGDIWYFPKGQAHTFQGLEDENEFILVFDNDNFDSVGTTFMLNDWLAHTPKSVLAQNLGVDESVLDDIPGGDVFGLAPTNVSTALVPDPNGQLEGNSSYVYKLSQKPAGEVPGRGGTLAIVDSRNFPVAKNIASAVVTLEPHGLRELHWHPNAAEWVFFIHGQGRATAFIGGGNARTFDFRAGDTGLFPEDAGHYIENTSDTEKLVWIEVYQSDHFADVSLTQWLALTPPDLVATALNIPVNVVETLKKQKQYLIKGN
ncbi:hypothetical protein MMC07_009377 [Pseudocyphellaria aurata]|nr:hypothetical protein [Pseudocyphellaria aurata]